MKKVFILTVIAAFFAACNSTPAVSESATKVADLTKWVDSVKGLVASASTFDSATWASYSEGFNNALTGINEAELDEVSKTALGTIKTTWEGVGSSYASGIENAKKAAAEAAMATDSTAKAADATLIEKVIETGKDVKDAVKK